MKRNHEEVFVAGAKAGLRTLGVSLIIEVTSHPTGIFHNFPSQN